MATRGKPWDFALAIWLAAPMVGAMDESWWVLPFAQGTPEFNMALDESLLEYASTLARPVLRFYGWTVPAATFGCFQRLAEMEAATPLRPVIRRPTAGGLVAHDADWTYSVTIPPGHSWHALRATESYCRVHRWIRDALAGLRVATDLAPIRDVQVEGRCFAGGWEQHDLVQAGRKIAGAAQRRNRMGLLIQGSVQPIPFGIPREDWESAMLRVGTDSFAARWNPLPENLPLQERAAQLAREKYSQPTHNGSR